MARQPAPRATVEQLDLTIEALADPLRRRTVELLADGPRPSGELAEELDIARPAMSKHLRVLRHCGVVTERIDDFDARVRIYSLRSAPMADVIMSHGDDAIEFDNNPGDHLSPDGSRPTDAVRIVFSGIDAGWRHGADPRVGHRPERLSSQRSRSSSFATRTASLLLVTSSLR